MFKALCVMCCLFFVPFQSRAEENQSKPRKVVVLGLYEEVTSESVLRVMMGIEAANNLGADSIVLEINSPGGSVWDGFMLTQMIERSRVKITCSVDGEAASMAGYILQGCADRVMTKRSVLMFHEPSMGGRMDGQQNAWQAIANRLKAMSTAMIEHLIAKMHHVTPKSFAYRIAGGKQWWMGYKEGLYYGAVDRVVDSTQALVDQLRKP